MKNVDSPKITNGTVIAAMDISKDSFTGYLRCIHNGAERAVRRYAMTNIDLQRFYTEAHEFMQTHECSQIILGFESTGVYHMPAVHYFSQKPIEILQVNTLHVKRMKDITDNSPAKTDEKDPRVIADLIELRRGMQVVIPTGVFLAMRATIHARERVIEHHSAITNQVCDLVHILFPEFHRFFKDIHGKTARMLLRKCALPQQVVALGVEKLASMMFTASRGRYTHEHARKFFAAALSSLGVTDGVEPYVDEIHTQLSFCEALEKAIENYEEKLAVLVQQTPTGRILLSVKGLGSITVAAVLGEYNGFEKFLTIADVLKYAGMDLTECSSGKKKGQRHLSKRGRPLLRKILYLAALNLVREGCAFRARYQAYLNKGKPKMVALIAIARKLLRTIFGMSKTMTEFRTSPVQRYLQAA